MRTVQRLPVGHARSGFLLFGLALVCAGLLPRTSLATPLYSASEGRTCDNCHLRPNEWKNPKLASRKCTMSCQACHVDPAGGGMRNAAGRFFGSATLPMIASNPRPTQDWDKWVGGWFYRRDKATTFNDSLPEGPPDFEAAQAFTANDRLSLGHPLGGPSRHALFQGREASLNADPMLNLSWDLRSALLITQGARYFPMQADVAAALHPVEHVTLLLNVGARGRAAGISQTFNDPRTPYLREGMLILHEAPGNAYLKAGRFVPAFGLRLEDHTTMTRRTFEQDGSMPETRVTGVEVGANPNYPYLSASWFRSTSRTRVPAAFDIFDTDAANGMAVDLGVREMGWSAGGSVLVHRRDPVDGGDATGYAMYGSLNPWFYDHGFPLTYQAEYDRGRFQRLSGLETGRAAFYQQFDWRAGNGIDLLFEQDWADPDTEVKDDHAFRVGFGVQVTPIPGITVDMRARALFPATGQSGADLFTQVHFWR